MGSIAAVQGKVTLGQRLTTFLHGLMFVLSFAPVFVLGWGGAVTSLGQLLGQFRIFLGRVGGVIVIAFGLATLSLIRLPWMYYDNRIHGSGFYTDVPPAELKSILVDKNFTLVYVHVPPGAMIASTDLSIPYTYITQNLDKLPADKDAKIVLYCRSGRMSAIAAKELLSLGYTNLLNPAGGTVAWQEAGLLLEGELPKQNNMNISNLAYTAHAPDYASSPASRHL